MANMCNDLLILFLNFFLLGFFFLEINQDHSFMSWIFRLSSFSHYSENLQVPEKTMLQFLSTILYVYGFC